MKARVQYCVLKNCNRTGIQQNKCISYHSFPKNDEDRQAWEGFVKKSDILFNQTTKIKPRSMLCSRHFRKGSFEYSRRFRSVKAKTPPTIFLDLQGNLISDTESKCNPDFQHTDVDPSPHFLNATRIHPVQSELGIYLAMLKSKEMIIACQKNKIKLLKRKLMRSKGKLEKFNAKPKVLSKSTQTLSQSSEGIAAESSRVPKILTDVLTRCQKDVHGEYSISTKEFALQTHFYSPKAYQFLRETFCKSLPHPRSFHLWTRSIDTRPGLFKSSLDFLKKRSGSSIHHLYYGLSLDGMSIRKQIIFDGSVMRGYVDTGNFNLTFTKPTEASDAFLNE